MGFGKACLSALVVPVVIAWTTNATAEVTRGVILRVTVHETLDGADLDRGRGTGAACRPLPESAASGVTAAASLSATWKRRNPFPSTFSYCR